MKEQRVLLDLQEVASRTRLSLSTVRRWASTRRIPTVKLGSRVLVPEEQLEAIIERATRSARADINI